MDLISSIIVTSCLGYSIELHKYISQHRYTADGTKVDTSALKDRFSAAWLSQHMEMTRKKALVENALYRADKALTDALRAKELEALQKPLSGLENGRYISLATRQRVI